MVSLGGEVMEEKETTTCYKCDTEIVAFVGQVHPLCEECEQEFDDWFNRELGIFGCGK